MALSSTKEQELDKKLQELSLQDFELFCIIAGVNRLQAYVCLEKSKGKSYGAIALTVGISRQAVSKRCKKCQLKD